MDEADCVIELKISVADEDASAIELLIETDPEELDTTEVDELLLEIEVLLL